MHIGPITLITWEGGGLWDKGIEGGVNKGVKKKWCINATPPLDDIPVRVLFEIWVVTPPPPPSLCQHI